MFSFCSLRSTPCLSLQGERFIATCSIKLLFACVKMQRGQVVSFSTCRNSPPDNEAMNRYRIREGGEAQFEQRWGSADSTIAGCLCWMSYGAVTQDTRKWRHCSTARCGSEAWMDFAGSAFYDECQAHLSRRERSPPAGRKSSSRVSSSIQANHGLSRSNLARPA